MPAFAPIDKAEWRDAGLEVSVVVGLDVVLRLDEGDDVGVADVLAGRSEDFQLIWYIGAWKYIVERVIVLDVSGRVKNEKAPEVPDSQETKENDVEAAREIHVWAYPAVHVYPLSSQSRTFEQNFTYVGQHPTAVSPAVIEYWTDHPDLPPAVAEQADEYPTGQINPGV
jgi:hypothetical protein